MGKRPPKLLEVIQTQRSREVATSSIPSQGQGEYQSARTSTSSEFEANFQRYEHFDISVEYDIVHLKEMSKTIRTVASYKFCNHETSTISILRYGSSARIIIACDRFVSFDSFLNSGNVTNEVECKMNKMYELNLSLFMLSSYKRCMPEFKEECSSRSCH